VTHDEYISMGVAKERFDFVRAWTSLEFILKEGCKIRVKPPFYNIVKEGNKFHYEPKTNESSFVHVTVSDEKLSVSTFEFVMPQKGYTTNLEAVPIFKGDVVVSNDVFYGFVFCERVDEFGTSCREGGHFD